MQRTRFLYACMFGAALALHGQEPVTVEPSAVPLPKLAQPEVFHSDLLDVTFTYPKSMKAQTLPGLKEQHDAMAAQLKNAGRPEDPTTACSDKALLAERKDEGGKLAAGTGHAVTAKIVMSRMGVSCMPASYQSQIDQVAASMSAALAQDKDLVPIDRPIWYNVGATRIYFAAGETARPNQQAMPGSDGATNARWVGSAAFVWGGNLISVVVESNDLGYFNELLHAKLSLGKAAGAALFPAAIGGGKPIQPTE